MGWPLGQDEVEAQAEPTAETTAIAATTPPVIDVTPRPISPRPGLFNAFGGLVKSVPAWVWTALVAAIVMWWWMRESGTTRANPTTSRRRKRGRR